MLNFNMSVSDNFAHFIVDNSTGTSVFVDSFDNEEFEVRFGTIEKSEYLCSFIAKTDQDLNNYLTKLVQEKLH